VERDDGPSGSKMRATHREIEEFAAARGWRFDVSNRSLVETFRGEPFHPGQTAALHHLLGGPYRDVSAVVFRYTETVIVDDGFGRRGPVGLSTWILTWDRVRAGLPLEEIDVALDRLHTVARHLTDVSEG
jgi:hypothetical protein